MFLNVRKSYMFCIFELKKAFKAGKQMSACLGTSYGSVTYSTTYLTPKKDIPRNYENDLKAQLRSDFYGFSLEV